MIKIKGNGFAKQERICNRNDFNLLFSDGESVFSYPFRCVFCKKESDKVLVRLAVSISKKKFKLATDRNRIKRRIREAYRLEKQELYHFIPKSSITLDILIIYTENKILNYPQFRKGIQGMIKKVLSKI